MGEKTACHGIHIYTRNPDYVYNSLLHAKSLQLSHLTVFSPFLLQCRTPYAVIHSLVLLKMGIMMPETSWDRSLIINTRLVASCWFLLLHPTFMMHGHKSLKFLEGYPAHALVQVTAPLTCPNSPDEIGIDRHSLSI